MSTDVTVTETRTLPGRVRLVGTMSTIGFFAFGAAWLVMVFLEVRQGRPPLSGLSQSFFYATLSPCLWGEYWSRKHSGARHLRLLFLYAVFYSVGSLLLVVICLVQYAGWKGFA